MNTVLFAAARHATSESEQFPVNLTFYITGNNLHLGLDLQRRATEIRLRLRKPYEAVA